jgi:hypothetical protein
MRSHSSGLSLTWSYAKEPADCIYDWPPPSLFICIWILNCNYATRCNILGYRVSTRTCKRAWNTSWFLRTLYTPYQLLMLIHCMGCLARFNTAHDYLRCLIVSYLDLSRIVISTACLHVHYTRDPVLFTIPRALQCAKLIGLYLHSNGIHHRVIELHLCEI